METERGLSAWRAEFPIVEKTVYMISNSLGAMPRKARLALEEYADLWETRGVRAWGEGWWTAQDQVTEHLAPILGVPQAALSMHQNVTIASAVFASSLEFPPGRDKIVCTELNFHSLLYLYEGLARARGASLVRVESDDGVSVPTERLLDAIDERTALVPISHVLFRSAYIQDARAVIAKAREVGAVVLLDVFQSVGIVPLALEDWGCHAAVGGVLKFCCGGPGGCFLYVEPELGKRLRPTLTGWMAHKRPFDFDPGPQDLREDGWRFLHGTPNVPGLYAAREGVRILAEIGVERIREQSMRQTALLVDKARDLGFEVKAPLDPEHRGGTVAVDVPHGYEVCRELNARDFIVDFRPGAGIRIAPHFYTLDEECAATLEEIASVLESGAWKRHAGGERRPG